MSSYRSGIIKWPPRYTEYDNRWGIPTIPKAEFVPDWLVPYHKRLRHKVDGKGAVHFFIDDFRFEALWWEPQRSIERVSTAGATLSPEFSVYTAYPLAAHVFNVYRSRWLGRFWADAGVPVIPTVMWGGPDSYDFAFDGLVRGTVCAIGTVGRTRWAADREMEACGLRELVRRVCPEALLVYGPMPTWLPKDVPTYRYPNCNEVGRRGVVGVPWTASLREEVTSQAAE